MKVETIFGDIKKLKRYLEEQYKLGWEVVFIESEKYTAAGETERVYKVILKEKKLE